MLNPIGAIVQAIIALYDTVMFFIENWQRIVDFVSSVFDSIGQIAQGAIGAAAGFIEKSLASTVPIIIAFLARFIGLGGIGKAIKNVIKKIQKPFAKVLDKVVKFVVKKVRKLFGKGKKGKKGKNKEEDNKEENNKEGVPKHLKVSKTGRIEKVNEQLTKSIEKTKSGTVIYKSSKWSPAKAVKNLLQKFNNAKFNKKTKTLTLPSVKGDSLSSSNSVKTLGKKVAEQTGLTQVTLNKNASGWSIGGKINPEIANLADYTGAPTTLEPLIKDIEGHAKKQNPSPLYFKSICKDAAKRYGATVSFEYIIDRSTAKDNFTEVIFKKEEEEFKTKIVTVKDNRCGACMKEQGTSNSHIALSSSDWREVITNVLLKYAPKALDTSSPNPQNKRIVRRIIGAGRGRGGNAVHDNKQCQACEIKHDTYSLLQRFDQQKPGEEWDDKQFKDATKSQVEQYTRDSIKRVIENIKKILLTDKKINKSDLYDLSQNMDAFIIEIENKAFERAEPAT